MSDVNNSWLNVAKHLLVCIKNFFTNIYRHTHKEGYIYIFTGIFITLLSTFIWSIFGVLCLVITCWMIAFFRDPERVPPNEKDVLSSPADGIITSIKFNQNLPEELDYSQHTENSNANYTVVSVFLNVFNVHVNRIPVESKVVETKYIEGKFLNASLDKSSKENERNIILLENNKNEIFAVTQIAGLIARRIVSSASKDNTYNIGERYGIIKFGSRVDIFVPQNYQISVIQGQTMVGGETIIAKRTPSDE